MVTLTFKFNEEKVREAGYTTDELLAPMREHSKQYDIDEVEYGVFVKDGIYALGAMERYIVRLLPDFLDCLDELILNVNGNEEDCIESVKRGIEKYNMYV